MNKRISSAIRLAISASLLYIAFQWADWDQIRLSLNYADWRFLVFALAIMTLNRMLMAYKWTLLLKARGTAIPVFTATRIYYTSHFLGLLLPATIGGDAIRVFLVKRLGVSIPKTLSSILVERIVGFITLVFLVILACGLLISYQNKLDFNPSQILVGAVIVGIILILCFLLPFHPLATKLLAAIPSAITERAMQLPKFGKIIETWNGYSGYGNHKGILALFAFLTLVENLMMPVWVYYVGLGLNTQIPILYLFMFIPLITFLSRMPISINGFGIQEGGYVYFLSLIGYNASIAFNIGLVNHLLMLISILPGVYFYATDKGLKRLGKRNWQTELQENQTKDAPAG